MEIDGESNRTTNVPDPRLTLNDRKSDLRVPAAPQALQASLPAKLSRLNRLGG